MRRLFGAYNIKVGQKGQSLVEFALILFLLITLLFGIMEFARAWQYSNALTNGVRDGAAFAVRQESSTDYATDVSNFTYSRIASANIKLGTFNVGNINVFKNNTIIFTGTDPNLRAGDRVKVLAAYDFYILTGSIIPFFSSDQPRTMIREATMRYESN